MPAGKARTQESSGRDPWKSPPLPTSQFSSGAGRLEPRASLDKVGGGASGSLDAFVITQQHRQFMVRGSERSSPDPQCTVPRKSRAGRGVSVFITSDWPLEPKIVCAWELGSQHILPRAGAGHEAEAESGSRRPPGRGWGPRMPGLSFLCLARSEPGGSTATSHLP